LLDGNSSTPENNKLFSAYAGENRNHSFVTTIQDVKGSGWSLLTTTVKDLRRLKVGGGKFAVHNSEGPPQEADGTGSLLSTTVKNLIRRLKVQEVCCLQQYSRTSVW
jgi:hypothetical protein